MQKRMVIWALAIGIVLQPCIRSMALEETEETVILEETFQKETKNSLETALPDSSDNVIRFRIEGEKASGFSYEPSISVYRNNVAEAKSSAIYTDCYGNQLSERSEEIYDGFVEWYVVQGESGVFQYSVSTPITMPVRVENGSIVKDEYFEALKREMIANVQPAYDAFRYDFPKVFWMDTIQYGCDVNVEISENSETGYVAQIDTFQFQAEELYDGAFERSDEFEASVQQVVGAIQSKLNAASNDTETIREIHNYVINNSYYVDSNFDDKKIYSPEPIFLGDGGMVCEGYAKAIKILCDEFGIPCACVSGEAVLPDQGNQPHMWNYIQMNDGVWYLVDSTWDDQDSGVDYTYFLAGANSQGFTDLIRNEYLPQGDVSGSGYMIFAFPILSEYGYEFPVEPPETLTGLKASAIGKQKVRLQWEAVPGAEGYLVYGQKNGKYGYVGLKRGDTTFTDTKALDSDYNYYWVFPYVKNVAGEMMTSGCEKYVYAKGVCAAVTNLKASSLTGGVKLTWTASMDAEGYLIYAQKKGKYGYCGMAVNGTTYVDKKALSEEYNFYWVFPYYEDANGKKIVGLTAPYTYGKAR